MLTGVYAITDDRLLPEDQFLARVEQALAAGVAMLQYRSKRCDRPGKLALARQLATLCRRWEVPLIVNDDVDLALECGAAGVHLGQRDTAARVARARLGAAAVIGVSCHGDLGRALAARDAGASYVAFGRFFPSLTKPAAPPAPLSLLGVAKERLDIPIVAIGGIDRDNGAAAIAAGADLLAVVAGVFGTAEVAANVRALRALFAGRTGGT